MGRVAGLSAAGVAVYALILDPLRLDGRVPLLPSQDVRESPLAGVNRQIWRVRGNKELAGPCG